MSMATDARVEYERLVAGSAEPGAIFRRFRITVEKLEDAEGLWWDGEQQVPSDRRPMRGRPTA